jgi:hypothetical protein
VGFLISFKGGKFSKKCYLEKLKISFVLVFGGSEGSILGSGPIFQKRGQNKSTPNDDIEIFPLK